MSAAEEMARAQLIGELVAEGMIERQAEVLTRTVGIREFMVEIKVLEVTE